MPSGIELRGHACWSIIHCRSTVRVVSSSFGPQPGCMVTSGSEAYWWIARSSSRRNSRSCRRSLFMGNGPMSDYKSHGAASPATNKLSRDRTRHQLCSKNGILSNLPSNRSVAWASYGTRPRRRFAGSLPDRPSSGRDLQMLNGFRPGTTLDASSLGGRGRICHDTSLVGPKKIRAVQIAFFERQHGQV